MKLPPYLTNGVREPRLARAIVLHELFEELRTLIEQGMHDAALQKIGTELRHLTYYIKHPSE